MDQELLERQKEIEEKKLAPEPLATKEIAAAAGTKNVLTSAAGNVQYSNGGATGAIRIFWLYLFK